MSLLIHYIYEYALVFKCVCRLFYSRLHPVILHFLKHKAKITYSFCLY